MTEYLHKEIHLDEKDIVEVRLKHRANVMLLDSANYGKYKSNQNFHYFGGYAITSPIRIPAPHSGVWHVVLDLGGESGTIEYSVTVIKHKDI